MKNILLKLLFCFNFIFIYSQNKTLNLLIGTYTTSCESNGIYSFSFDSQTGKVKLKNSSEKIINPSYLSISKDSKFVYAVSENGDKSSVSAFNFNKNSGKLTLINTENAHGNDPCFIIEDQKNILIANYSGGNISVFEKKLNGGINPIKQSVQHFGKGAIKGQQDFPHVHQVQFSPDKKLIIASDLGTDKIYTYNYFPNEPKNILTKKDSILINPGSGPRHLTFTPNGKYAYLLTENTADIISFKYENQKLTKIQEISMLAKNWPDKSGAADIHISPDGKFLYSSNRANANDIACFEITKNGTLTYVDRTSTFGKGPRNFVIDPSGNFLLVGNQTTNQVIIFRRNKKTGKLTKTNEKIDLCSPVCLVFSE